jgi:hypothetical protein
VTGHDDRRILSSTPDMMTTRTGSSDMMSAGYDLRKRPSLAVVDMMTRFRPWHMIQASDLRKRVTCRGSVRFADIMSNPTVFVTARSGRRNP